MGRNVRGLELTAQESSDLAHEWTISDLMEDEKSRLEGLLNAGKITRDEFFDGMDRLRETAEKRYIDDCITSESEPFNVSESDWDYLQEYLEAF